MKTKTMLRKAQEIARKNREYMKKNPYRCATCRHWKNLECAQFPNIRGLDASGGLLEDGSESCWNGWEGMNGERRPGVRDLDKTVVTVEDQKKCRDECEQILSLTPNTRSCSTCAYEKNKEKGLCDDMCDNYESWTPKPVPKGEEISGTIVFVVLAKRWGCNERHSYVVGAASSLGQARKIAEKTEQDRGGKYSCDILVARTDLIPEEPDALPGIAVKADQTQPEPGEAEWLCEKHYKCPHIKRASSSQPGQSNVPGKS